MRKTVNYKKYIVFAVVLIILISITVVPAYAEFPPLTTGGRRLGAWIMSALTAMNIALTSSVSTSQGADLINFLADPLDVTYSYTEAWADRPTIQIWDNYVTIDGQTYTDIWLSNEAASKFKTDGLDFTTAYSIASNTNGTFASGEGYLGGLPLFEINNVIQSQKTTTPVTAPITDPQLYQFGDFQVGGIRTSTQNIVGYYDLNNTWNNAYTTTKDSSINANSPYTWKIQKAANNNTMYMMFGTGGAEPSQTKSVVGYYQSNPFDFDWVAGNIDSTPLTSDQGMMIRVPSDTPGLQTFITNNYYLTEPTVIDPSLDPDIMLDIDDLADILAPILVNLDNDDITFVINHTEPAPQPDVPIVDATVPQVVNPIINEITNYGDQITQQIPQIIETIPTIDEICNNIDTAPYHDLDTGLDKLPTVLLPFITDLRSALGIWHYVTEWLSMIGTSFAFVTGALNGTAIMTPIYAAIAGYMCIKVYRRMTG